MKAAVVGALGLPPIFQDFPEPHVTGDEATVAVRAIAISPILKGVTSARHYANFGGAGFVPGVDGVGLDRAGRRVYFIRPRAPFGSLAEKTLVDPRMMTPLPDALGDAAAAVMLSAGLATWLALTRRAPLTGGETVLLLGASGAEAGVCAQIARHLGAGRLVSERGLSSLKPIVDSVDVVLDFVGGEAADGPLKAAVRHRGSGRYATGLRCVQLLAGSRDDDASRAALLGSFGGELLTCDLRAATGAELIAGAGELLAAAPSAGFAVPHRSLPLRSVAHAWSSDSATPSVLIPHG